MATGAGFMREVLTGAWESDMGLWQGEAAHVLRERRRLDAESLTIMMNITPEFASPIGRRSPAEAARSAVVSSLADAILVSGPMAGAEPGRAMLEEVREAVPPEIPVLLNTGARADTIADYLQVADGCIVGSDLKVDGYTWNPVDRRTGAAVRRKRARGRRGLAHAAGDRHRLVGCQGARWSTPNAGVLATAQAEVSSVLASPGMGRSGSGAVVERRLRAGPASCWRAAGRRRG